MNRFFFSIILSFASIPMFGACAADVDEVDETDSEPTLVVDVEQEAAEEEEEIGTTSQAYGCGRDVERWCNSEAKMYAMTSGGCFRLVQHFYGNLCFKYGSEIECGWGTWAYCVYP